MATYTVYIDQVFLGNLAMNYAVLWAAAKLSRTKAAMIRLVAGAALGAAYSLALFLPGNHVFLTIWFKAAASVIITAAAFVPLHMRKFFVCLGCFYLASFTLGGLVFGMIFFIHSGQVASINGVGGVIAEHFWSGIFLGLVAFGVAAKGIGALYKKGFWENLFKMALLIKSGGEQVRVGALLDTGNSLREPMTKHPVVVVEYTYIKPLLPAEVRASIEESGGFDVWEVLGSLGETRYASCFCAIPFHSLGEAKGLMLGFRPDWVAIERQGRVIKADKAVVAIYHEKLDPEGTYQALLSHDLLQSVA